MRLARHVDGRNFRARGRLNWTGQVTANVLERCCSRLSLLTRLGPDIFGMSGRQMLERLIAGRRDLGWLADFARTTMRRRKPELESALEGTLNEHPRRLLAAQLRHLDWWQSEVAAVQRHLLKQMESYQAQVQRLNSIPGVEELTASTIAELGDDCAAFPRDDKVANWVGLCPGNKVTAGQQLSGRTKHGNPYLRRALNQAAHAAVRAKGTYPAALYRHMLPRMSQQAAIVAVAHWMVGVAYHILHDGTEYYEIGGDYFDQLNKPRTVRRLVERLLRLGYHVDLKPVDGAAAKEKVPIPKTWPTLRDRPAAPGSGRWSITGDLVKKAIRYHCDTARAASQLPLTFPAPEHFRQHLPITSSLFLLVDFSGH